jgi:glycosyltransferase involved in cell wall biosynthesis
MTMPSKRVGLFMYGLTGGGVARRMVTLANGLAARGYRVDLILVNPRGELAGAVDAEVRVVDVGGWRVGLPVLRRKRRWQFRAAQGALVRYLNEAAPAVLISADNYANLTAIAARSAARKPLRLVVSQRNHTSTYAAGKPQLVAAIRSEYPKADAIVAVSQGVARDLVGIGLPEAMVQTIYNPLVGPELAAAMERPVTHPWFAPGEPPVILAAGRLGRQKDFPTLIRAFARLRADGRPARLVILGDGKAPKDRAELLELAASLGMADCIDLPGAVPEAIPYMARAGLFVLSSAWEGLPGVLIEALACGTPVASTDCPSGPSEILENGRLGPLVPVGDDRALAAAMAAVLDAPPDPAILKQRAAHFSIGNALDRYVALIEGEPPATRL